MYPKERTVLLIMKSKKLTKLMKIQAVVFAAVFAAGVASERLLITARECAPMC